MSKSSLCSVVGQSSLHQNLVVACLAAAAIVVGVACNGGTITGGSGGVGGNHGGNGGGNQGGALGGAGGGGVTVTQPVAAWYAALR